ncbi:hypothetical protein [uncultured Azohydromonas sp.]|uniref:hypothetical protein n=1 Tax=uncultured Azohydromonas sp. TaxID=487342 RepID=UPI002607A5BF|nr:hypothetical protein [uncultured Azohydromonas sp.]
MGARKYQNEAGAAAAPALAAGPPLGVTLDLFGGLDAAFAGPPADEARRAARGRSRARREAPATQRPAAEARVGVPFSAQAPDEAPARLAVPAAVARELPSGPVEQALLALPTEQLQCVVGRVATAIVRSAEFQMALRAQLYTLVAPAITEALRGALSRQEIRESLRESVGPGALLASALAGRPGAVPPPTPGVAQVAPSPLPADVVPPEGEAVMLAGYEPAIARGYKTALAEAGYEALIVEIGPNDQALPVEAYRCAIACLPDDVLEHVESVVSRHPLRKVLHLSVTARRLVEAVELELPLGQAQP